MTESIRVSAVIPAPPQHVYEAWLDPRLHSAMTGGRATSSPGGRFTAWDGYISGWTLVKEPPRRIVQAWRTTEFPEGATDSRVEVLFERAGGGTRVTIAHSEIPEGQGTSYESGWQSFYFAPMRAYFAGVVAAAQQARRRQKATGKKGPKGSAKARTKPKARRRPAKPRTRATATRRSAAAPEKNARGRPKARPKVRPRARPTARRK